MRFGVGVAVLAVMAVWATFHDYSGGFGSYTYVDAEISAVGDSLKRGDIVTYRDVIVGSVSDFAPSTGGGAVVELRIDQNASRIPSNVTAFAAPADLFGSTEIVLSAPITASAARLRSGQTVSADTSTSAAGLQTALSDGYDLVTAVRPAELNAALAALGEAISGRGTELQRLVRDANDTLRVIAADVPQLTDTIESFADVTDELAADTPELLTAVGDLLEPAQVIVDQRETITALFDVAPPTADRATRLIDQTQDDIVTTVVTQQDFLQALAADPDLVGRVLKNGSDVAKVLNDITKGGRFRADAFVTGINLAGIVQSIAGKGSVVLEDVSDPRLYSARDCATFGYARAAGCKDAPARSSASEPTASLTADKPSSSRGANDKVAKDLADVLTQLGKNNALPGLSLLLAPLLGGAN